MGIREFFGSFEFFWASILTSVVLLLIVLLTSVHKVLKEIKKIKVINSQEKLASTSLPVLPLEKKPVSVTQIELKASDGTSVILDKNIEKTLAINIDDYIQLPVGKLSGGGISAQSMVSNAVATSGQIGAISLLNPKGLFTAIVNPEMLTKFADGTFSTMIHGADGIAQHAGFQAASASVFAPIILFQAMSMITGQYYLNGITKQLSAIDNKLSKLIKLHHVERIATIRYAVSLLKRNYAIEYPNIEDIVSLKNIENNMGIIHEEYVYQLSDIGRELIMSSQKWRTSKKLEALYDKVNDVGFDFVLNMAITTDEVLHIIRLIELVHNTRMKDNIENRANRVSEIIREIKSWDSNDFYRARYANNEIAEFYGVLIDKAEEIYNDANIYKEKAKQAIDDFKNRQSQREENIGGKIHVLEMGRHFIEQLANPVEVIFVVGNEMGDSVLIRKKGSAPNGKEIT